MPRRGTSCGWQLARSKSSNATLPRLFLVSPMMARSVVVLPTPFRPSSAAHSPGFTASVTPWRMWRRPMWTCTPSRLSTGGLLDVVFILLATQIGLAHALVGRDRAGGAGGKYGAL